MTANGGWPVASQTSLLIIVCAKSRRILSLRKESTMGNLLLVIIQLVSGAVGGGVLMAIIGVVERAMHK
jgi:hypothetical protein